MGSKSSNYVSTVETVDNSAINGLASVRGDGNKVNVLDNDAIKDAFAFANKNNDGTNKSLGDVIGVFGSLANKAFESSAKTTSDALKGITSTTGSLNSAITTATTKLQNSGIDPQVILLGVLALVGFMVFKK